MRTGTTWPGRSQPGRSQPGRSQVAWRLVTLVLTLALGLTCAWPVRPAQAASGQRSIIFVSGILTTGESSISSFQPITTALVDGVLDPRSFGYFSYRGEWTLDCLEALGVWCHPVYDHDDTRRPVARHFPALNRMVQQIVADAPNVDIDLVGYSLGGVLVLSWLGTSVDQGGPDDATARHVRSVVALDSPLQGLSKLADWRDWKQAVAETGLIFGDASRDLLPGAPILQAVASGVRRPWNGTYAVENSADPVVNGLMLTGADGVADVAGLCRRFVGAVVPQASRDRLVSRSVDSIVATHGLVLSDPDAIKQVLAYLSGQRGGCQL